MLEEGKKAEVIRRASVKNALAVFNAVIATEKSASLLAEKSYKADVKANLYTLTKATTALSSDVKITAARAVFAKIRTTTMTKFKAALEFSAKERGMTIDRASLRYKADKARALVTLRAAPTLSAFAFGSNASATDTPTPAPVVSTKSSATDDAEIVTLLSTQAALSAGDTASPAQLTAAASIVTSIDVAGNSGCGLG